MAGFYTHYMQKIAETEAKPFKGTDVPTMRDWFTPKPHQEAAVKRLFENDGKMLMVHATGTGKASAHSAMVYTPDGPRPMGEIRAGDTVLNPAGGTTTVLEVHPQGCVPIFKVTMSDGSTTRTTADHLWTVNTKSRRHCGRPDTVQPLSALMASGLYDGAGGAKYFIPITAPAEFTCSPVEIDPYLLGLLLGDGGLSQTALKFTTLDPFLLTAVKALLPDDVDIVLDTGIDYRLRTGRGGTFRAALKKYDLLGKHSYDKHIPSEYLYNSVDVRVSLLQGLLDTDGSPGRTGGVDYITTSKQMAYQVRELVQSLGGLAAIYETFPEYMYKGEKLNGLRAYRMYLTIPIDFSPFLLARKIAKYRVPTKYYPTRAIVSILPDGVEDASCILLDSHEHLYLTDSFIVTHNTATSIYGFEKMRHAGKAAKAIVITPAGLRTNYADAAKEFTTSKVHVANRPQEVDPAADYNVVGYETFRQDPIGIMQRSGADTMIVDEYHRIRNEDASTNHALFAGRQLAKNFIGLTASFINNRPAEIAPLLALSENNPALTRSDFNAKFVRTAGSLTSFTGKERPRLGIKNEKAFVRAVYPKVDFVATEDIPGNSMPRKQVTNVPVPMSEEQYKLYQLALNKLGPISEYITQQDPNVSVKDTNRIFTQIGQARQIANSVHMGRSDVTPEEAAVRTPKVHRVIEDTARHLSEKPDNNVVLYTNLVHGGVDVLSAGLRKAGIDYATFIGKGTEVDGANVTEASRQAGVKDFKEGRKRVILISGAGAEGLDLKNATAFYALDGHFNPERILQAEARARRLGGQAQRPEAQRVVDVRRYQSTAPASEQPGFFSRMIGRKAPRTTDQWMYDVAGEKYKTNKQFYEALKKPDKYIRKEIAPSGKVRYIYPEEVKQPGFFARMTGAPEAQFKYETPT